MFRKLPSNNTFTFLFEILSIFYITLTSSKSFPATSGPWWVAISPLSLPSGSSALPIWLGGVCVPECTWQPRVMDGKCRFSQTRTNKWKRNSTMHIFVVPWNQFDLCKQKKRAMTRVTLYSGRPGRSETLWLSAEVSGDCQGLLCFFHSFRSWGLQAAHFVAWNKTISNSPPPKDSRTTSVPVCLTESDCMIQRFPKTCEPK